jgi:rare lipoprotein A
MRGIRTTAAILVAVAALAGCAKKAPPPPGKGPSPGGRPGEIFQRGEASWYGNEFHGRKTASGEVYDQWAMTAAHRTLPFQTWVRVENTANGKTVDVRITDRGPFIHGRVIDLSRGSARVIDLERMGVARVELRLLGRRASPPQERPDPPLVEVDPHKGLFDVQTGAFTDPGRARKQRDRLKRDYKGVHIVRFGEFYRVRIGPFDKRSEADSLKLHLELQRYKPFVVRHDPEEERTD